VAQPGGLTLGFAPHIYYALIEIPVVKIHRNDAVRPNGTLETFEWPGSPERSERSYLKRHPLLVTHTVRGATARERRICITLWGLTEMKHIG